MPRLVDLFCGCGGMSLGFQEAGFDIIESFDNWAPAIATYSANFNHPITSLDLSDSDRIISHLKDKDIDIIIGGPPCQDFSIAGKRDFLGNRANLTLSYAKAVTSLSPEWFVMENVYNIQKSPIFQEAIKMFSEAGYGLNIRILDASLMGVPQQRKRCFVIGKMGAKDNFLDQIIDSKLSTSHTTVRQYLGETLGTDFYYMHPRSYNRRAIFSIDEPSSTIRGVNRPMPSTYKFHPADKCTDYSKIRALSYVERSYLQTFPNGYEFKGSNAQIEQQIGNAVPVKMAEFVATIIFENF